MIVGPCGLHRPVAQILYFSRPTFISQVTGTPNLNPIPGNPRLEKNHVSMRPWRPWLLRREARHCSALFLRWRMLNHLIATLKPQSNGPSYSNRVIGTLAVDGCTFGTAMRGLGGVAAPPQAPPRCTKCNSQPINGQCTNFALLDVAQ